MIPSLISPLFTFSLNASIYCVCFLLASEQSERDNYRGYTIEIHGVYLFLIFFVVFLLIYSMCIIIIIIIILFFFFLHHSCISW